MLLLCLGIGSVAAMQFAGPLTSRFGAHHAVIVAAILGKLEFLDELIAGLTEQIEVAIAPFSRQLDLLVTIPGIDRRTGQGLLAEVGAGADAGPPFSCHARMRSERAG